MEIEEKINDDKEFILRLVEMLKNIIAISKEDNGYTLPNWMDEEIETLIKEWKEI